MPTPPPPEHSRFRPGQSGNPGGRPRRCQTDDLLALIDESNANRVISKVWLKAILKGDFRFLREYLDRLEGKVPGTAKEDKGDDAQPSYEAVRKSIRERHRSHKV